MDQPGFYSTSRKSVKAYIARYGRLASKGYMGESQKFDQVIGTADASLLSHMGLAGTIEGTEVLVSGKSPC